MKPRVFLSATKPAEHRGTGSAKPKAGTGGLLEAALTRQNLQTAWKRVKANKGAAGVDGQGIEQTAQLICQRWPEIRQALLAGRYRPSPVRKVLIPKPDGSQRELGIPTVTDRLIQQAGQGQRSQMYGGPIRHWTTSRPASGNSRAPREDAA